MQTLHDDLHQDLAGLTRRDAIELGRVTEEMHRPFDEAMESQVGGVEPVQLHPLLLDDLAEERCRNAAVGPHQLEQCVRDRRPHVGFAVRRTDARENDDIPTWEPCERFGHETRLAAPRLARHRHDRSAAVGNETHDRGQQFALRGATDERQIVARRLWQEAGQPTRDPPDLLGLIASAQVGLCHEFSLDRWRQLCFGAGPDVDTAGWRHGLESRRHVDDVTHCGVVIPTRDSPDDDLTGVHSDTQ